MRLLNKKRKIEVLNYNIKQGDKNKNTTKKHIAIFCIILMAIFSLWGVISLTTTNNFISKSTNKILSQAGIYLNANNEVLIQSSSNIDKDMWNINKKAEWTSSTTAKVIYELNSEALRNKKTEDIIIILDISESMRGTKLDKAKESIKDLINTAVDKDNKAAIILFNSDSIVATKFTNDKDQLINSLDNITLGKDTNYYAGLRSIYDVMKEYSNESQKEIVTLFITDGKPNVSTPNEKNVYKALKEKYKNMKIYGIQYEMNLTKVVNELKNISEDQWIATEKNISNVLKEAVDLSNNYEKFIITDEINTKYFKIIDKNTIKTTLGEVTIDEKDETQKLIWNLNDKYATGAKQTLEFEVVLKDEYQDNEGNYPIIKNEDINYIYNTKESSNKNYETPVLNTKYEITFDVNAPKGCSLGKYDKEKYSVFQNVKLKNDELVCDGYVFKGWEVLDDNISNINDEVFIMPGHDVTIRALWGTPKLKLSIDGQVYQSSKIYKVLEDAANNKLYAKKYTGEHKDSYDDTLATKDIYYFADERTKNNLAINEKNNVIFANHCWQIIRTTDNGGVKLLYNGEPDENNQCTTEKRNHIEIKDIKDNVAIDTNWYYGENYSFDSKTNKFKLTNIVGINSENYMEIQGKYTCALTNENEECSTLYYIQSINNLLDTSVVSLTSNDKYNQIGSFAYNQESNSPSYLGYKYGDVYKESETNISQKQDLTTKTQILKTTSIKNKQFLYSDSIIYNESGYTLVNPELVTSYEDSILKEKYTLFKTDNQKTTTIYQIIGIDNETAYYIELNSGVESYKDYSPMIIGDIDNNIIVNQTTVNVRDWFENSKEFTNKYTCINNSTCNNPKYIVDTTKSTIKYIDMNTQIIIAKSREGLNLQDYKTVSLYEFNKEYSKIENEGYKYTCNNLSTTCQDNELRLIVSYQPTEYTYITNHYFAPSVEWTGTGYKLVNYTNIESYNNEKILENNHYTCIESGTKECNKVAYIYSIDDTTLYYILLENGITDINIIKNNMFQKNTNDSTIKKVVESWYELNLKNYSQYIEEDTVYCNNREIVNNTGWNNNSNPFKSKLKFKVNELVENSLACTEITDQFSYKNEYAKLSYPIALATQEELTLAGNEETITENEYWTMTPNEFDYKTAYMGTSGDNNYIGKMKVNSKLSIRPVITLKYGTEFDDGDGTKTNPYHINTGEE